MNLYHYCSNAAFLSIVSKREIWASEFSLSNDALEGKWALDIFRRFCSEKGIRELDIAALVQDWALMSGIVGGVGFCLSEEGDLLSQWRAYANDGAGVSIGFSKEYFEALGNLKMNRNDKFNAHITKVIYDEETQRELVAEHGAEIIKLVQDGGLRTPSLIFGETDDELRHRQEKRRKIMFGLFLVFFRYVHSLKNPAFAEEKEWRLISHVLGGKDPLKELKEMEFRSLIDRIIPFRRIALDDVGIAPIAEVVLGPRNITPKEIVIAMLRKCSIEDVTVRRSSASYR